MRLWLMELSDRSDDNKIAVILETGVAIICSSDVIGRCENKNEIKKDDTRQLHQYCRCIVLPFGRT